MKRFGFSVYERIKSRKEIEQIFTGGETTFSSDNKLRANYTITSELESPGVMIAAAPSKKLGNAVWRNRIKRLIRESYRLNKADLVERCKSKDVLLKIILSPQSINQTKNKNPRLSEIEINVKEIISNLIEKI